MTTETVSTGISLDGVKFDDITRMLATQVVSGISEIDAANVVLLDSESETGVRAITAMFKEEKIEDKPALDAWAKYLKAQEQAKKFHTDAINAVRVNVLNEEEKPETDVDKDAVKEIRKRVMSSLTLMKDFATANNLTDVIKWADTVSVPQVGRQGTSSVGGTKKPRAYVTFNETTHDSFGEAAKAWSAIEGNETITSADLVQAWSDAGEGETFTYKNVSFKVTAKVRASAE